MGLKRRGPLPPNTGTRLVLEAIRSIEATERIPVASFTAVREALRKLEPERASGSLRDRHWRNMTAARGLKALVAEGSVEAVTYPVSGYRSVGDPGAASAMARFQRAWEPLRDAYDVIRSGSNHPDGLNGPAQIRNIKQEWNDVKELWDKAIAEAERVLDPIGRNYSPREVKMPGPPPPKRS